MNKRTSSKAPISRASQSREDWVNAFYKELAKPYERDDWVPPDPETRLEHRAMWERVQAGKFFYNVQSTAEHRGSWSEVRPDADLFLWLREVAQKVLAADDLRDTNKLTTKFDEARKKKDSKRRPDAMLKATGLTGSEDKRASFQRYMETMIGFEKMAATEAGEPVREISLDTWIADAYERGLFTEKDRLEGTDTKRVISELLRAIKR